MGSKHQPTKNWVSQILIWALKDIPRIFSVCVTCLCKLLLINIVLWVWPLHQVNQPKRDDIAAGMPVLKGTMNQEVSWILSGKNPKKHLHNFSVDLWSVLLICGLFCTWPWVLPFCVLQSVSVMSWTKPANVWQKCQLHHKPAFLLFKSESEPSAPSRAEILTRSTSAAKILMEQPYKV